MNNNLVNTISIELPSNIRDKINKINNQERNEKEIQELINHVSNTGGFKVGCYPNECLYDTNPCFINSCWFFK